MHPYHSVKLENGAQLLLTPCPGTKTQNLTDSLHTLAKAQCCAVVTLLTNNDLERLNVADIREQTHQQGMQWFHLPIEDDQSPSDDYQTQWQIHKSDILDRVKQGKTIALHCQGGTGRTGTVAASILLELGHPWPSVKAAIQSVKPKALTIPAQLAFLARNYELDIPAN